MPASRTSTRSGPPDYSDATRDDQLGRQARQEAARAKINIAAGNDPSAEKRASTATRAPIAHDLVEHVVETFIARYAKPKQRPKTAYETERLLRREIVSQWRGRRLSEIRKPDIRYLLDSIVDRGAPILANRTLAAFRTMCSWAVEQDMLDASPCTGFKAPTIETSRDRVLNDSELVAVWRAAEAIGWPWAAIVKLLILTGQRCGEVAGMTWREIDLGARLWTLPKERTKNGLAHSVPLSKQALAVLTTVLRVESKSGLVFTTNGAVPVAGFAGAKKRLDAALPSDMDRWTFHDLRRSFASGCARLGIDLRVVEKCLNHVSGSFAGIVGVYQRHDFGNEKRAAMDAWGNYVETLLSDAP